MQINIQTDNSFFNTYHTLTEAKKFLSDYEQTLVDKTTADKEEIDFLKTSIDLLIARLLDKQLSDPLEFQNIQSDTNRTYLSVLSTTRAFMAVYEALVEVHLKLKEEKKHYQEKRSQSQQEQSLEELRQETLDDLKELSELSQMLQEKNDYQFKQKLSEVNTFKQHLKNRYGVDLKLSMAEFDLVV